LASVKKLNRFQSCLKWKILACWRHENVTIWLVNV
jgi:hypothetical protein